MINTNTNQETLTTAEYEIKQALETKLANVMDTAMLSMTEFAGDTPKIYKKGENIQNDIQSILEKYDLNPDMVEVIWNISVELK